MASCKWINKHANQSFVMLIISLIGFLPWLCHLILLKHLWRVWFMMCFFNNFGVPNNQGYYGIISTAAATVYATADTDPSCQCDNKKLFEAGCSVLAH